MDAAATTSDLDVRLARLQDEYTYRVNLLLDQGREELAAAMVMTYLDERDQLQREASTAPAGRAA